MASSLWYHNHVNLAALWRWLEDRGEAPTDGPAYFMEKPWKWEGEWLAMQHEKRRTIRGNV